jgi:Family of unknown function (DUF6459)
MTASSLLQEPGLRRGTGTAVRLRSRRGAPAGLPPPATVAGGIAMALLEIEAGCRSVAQLERVCTPELWSMLEQTVLRRGGPFPAGNALIRVHCQENSPGRADAVAVVRRGARVQAMAMRLDASGGRWVLTTLEVLRYGPSAAPRHRPAE